MNRKNMRKLIKETLEAIDHFYDITKSDINLIELTFLMQSDMEMIFSLDPYTDKRGFFMISKEELEDILINVLKPSKKACSNILTTCLVDVYSDSLDDLFEAAAYNLAFQIVVLFYFYYTKLKSMPSDVEECVDSYYKKWKKVGTVSSTQRHAAIKAFIEYDKEVKK